MGSQCPKVLTSHSANHALDVDSVDIAISTPDLLDLTLGDVCGKSTDENATASGLVVRHSRDGRLRTRKRCYKGRLPRERESPFYSHLVRSRSTLKLDTRPFIVRI